jgi:hypothetical protein
MKGLLTFTLAAGVAISTTSVVHATGVVKGASNANKAPASAQAPMGIGSMGITLDRVSLTRELDRLNSMLNPSDGEENSAGLTQKTTPTWTY